MVRGELISGFTEGGDKVCFDEDDPLQTGGTEEESGEEAEQSQEDNSQETDSHGEAGQDNQYDALQFNRPNNDIIHHYEEVDMDGGEHSNKNCNFPLRRW